MPPTSLRANPRAPGRRRRLLAALLVAGSLTPWTASAADPDHPPRHAPGRLVVKLSAELAPKMRAAVARGRGGVAPSGNASLDALIRRHRGRGMHAPFAARQTRAAQLAARFPRRAARATPAAAPALDRIFVLELSPDLDMEETARAYAQQPGVEWAEPDRVFEAVFVPNDPFFASSGAWGQPYRDLWGLVAIDAPGAWDITRGAGVIVAISDTGIDGAHPDVATRMWTNPGEIAGNSIDDDGNGYVDDVGGWDAVNHDNDPFDDNGHGTHCAGTVAASGNNALGITGVAFEASLMAVKGLDAGGSGVGTALADSIVYATDNGADVINASWGGGGISFLIRDAVMAAHAAGVVFIAAAGNFALDVEGDIIFCPACLPEAITVAASTHLDVLAGFSNIGAKIDVAAPGGGDTAPPENQPGRSILSLHSSGSRFADSLRVAGLYTRLSGTSMASPHVAGAAALVLAAHPDFSPDQVRQALRASADDIEAPGWDTRAGYGRLNVAQAVSLDNVLAARITAPARLAIVAQMVPIVGTAAGPGFLDYTLEYGTAPSPSVWHPIAGPLTTPVEEGVLGTWNASTVPDGSYVLRLRARSTDGTFEDRIPVSIDSVALEAPLNSDIVGVGGAPIEFRGSAGGAGFGRYIVEYRITVLPSYLNGPWTSAGVSLVGGGTTPVGNGLLGTLDPAALSGPQDIDVRLTVITAGGSFVDQVTHVVADPTLRAGWPRNFGRVTGDNVTLADLDGDGGKEIVFLAENRLFALRGDGSHLPGWPRTPDTQSFRDAPPSVADLDGDQSPEVVTPLYFGIDVRRADGTFVAAVNPGAYSPAGPITLADLDGDGRRDFVFAAFSTGQAIRSDGTQIPSFPVSPFGSHLCDRGMDYNCFENTAAVGDVDGDGRPEAVFIHNDERGRQYLHVVDDYGDLLPRYPKKINKRRHFFDNAPVMADLDGDGRLEVVVNDDGHRINAWASDAHRRRFPASGKLPDHVWGKFHAEQEPVTVGDLDGDGLPELLVARAFAGALVRRGETIALTSPYSGRHFLVALNPALPAGGWSQTFDFPFGERMYGPGSAAIGDIDGDGGQDVVIGSGTCGLWERYDDPTLRRCFTVYAYRADGSLIPGFPKPTARAGRNKITTPALGDLDGDGLKEVVWIDGRNNILVWTIPGTPGPENMQWPMYRHDAAHTGALVPNP